MAAVGARFQAALRGTLQLGAHERVLLGRRHGADEQLLRCRRAARHRGALRRGSHRARAARRRVRVRDGASRTARAHELQRTRSRARGRRLRGEPRLAARSVGRRGAQLPDPRHAVQHRDGAAAMLDAGAAPVGDPRECHAVAIDGRAPKFDGGIVTRLDCVPLGIVVNRARRAVLRRGRGLLAEALRDLGQARRTATRRDRLFDHRRQSARPLHAVGLSADRSRVDARARRHSSACPPSGSRRPSRRSIAPCSRARSITRRSTTAAPIGLAPEQDALGAAHRHPAVLRLSAAARHHVHLSRRARRRTTRACSATNGAPFENVYAAGEIMAGNVLRKGYVAGIGMTIGTVFGRIAGESAARHANE